MPSPSLAAPATAAQQLGASPALSWALWASMIAALITMLISGVVYAVGIARQTCGGNGRALAVMVGSALIAAGTVVVSQLTGTTP